MRLTLLTLIGLLYGPRIVQFSIAQNVSDNIGVTSVDTSTSEPITAIRVVRFRVDYPDADVAAVARTTNWNAIMRKSVLASLRFVNKHWLICGGAGETEKNNNDCGRLQVTGEEIKDGAGGYRLNATFIANRDPIRNFKVDGATSTVLNVIQIGLHGGIFQYTNAMKLLGKPNGHMDFEEAFFCFPGYRLTNEQFCEKDLTTTPSPALPTQDTSHHKRKHRRNVQLQSRVAVAAVAARHNRPCP